MSHKRHSLTEAGLCMYLCSEGRCWGGGGVTFSIYVMNRLIHQTLLVCFAGVLLLEILDHKDIVRDLHFTRDDSLRLVSASQDGTLKLWEFDEQGDCNLYLTIKTNSKHTFGCRWSPNGKYLAAVGSFKMVSSQRL